MKRMLGCALLPFQFTACALVLCVLASCDDRRPSSGATSKRKEPRAYAPVQSHAAAVTDTNEQWYSMIRDLARTNEVLLIDMIRRDFMNLRRPIVLGYKEFRIELARPAKRGTFRKRMAVMLTQEASDLAWKYPADSLFRALRPFMDDYSSPYVGDACVILTMRVNRSAYALAAIGYRSPTEKGSWDKKAWVSVASNAIAGWTDLNFLVKLKPEELRQVHESTNNTSGKSTTP